MAGGGSDPFRDSNHQVSTALWAKGVWHALHIWEGGAHSASH